MVIINTIGNESNAYSFNDGITYNGKAYYRLKIIDNDGKFAYSIIVIINSNGKSLTSIYPNPINDIVTLTVHKTLLNTDAIIIDAKGAVFQKVKITQLQNQINIERFSKGMYILKTITGSIVKIIKQ